MGVVKVNGESEWNSQLTNAGGKLVVVDFSATWCGPCQMIKPVVEQLSNQYTDVLFLEVDEGSNRSLISALGVRGFPTFHFYVSQSKVDELVGADQNALRQKIEQWRQSAFNPFASTGTALGGGSSIQDAREARLRRLANLEASQAKETQNQPKDIQQTESKASEDQEMVCDMETGVCHVPEPASNKSVPSDSTPEVNPELMSQLQEMGFPEIRCKKALLATNGQGLEDAVNWIGEHQDDADIDAPIQYLDMAQHAKKPLTAEEKEKKIEELKAKMKAKRAERQENEKVELTESEIKRRQTGKGMQEAQAEHESLRRKRDIEMRKKEKEDAKRERERLRRELERDKMERKARGGRLGGPPIDLPNTDGDNLPLEAKEKKEKKEKEVLSPEEQMDKSLDKLKRYRVAGDGHAAVKTLGVYVKNLLEKPDEEKFRSINLENAAFKKRVGGLVGGISFLKALGYEKDGTTLVLSLEKRDEALLKTAQEKLSTALTELA